MLSTQDYIQHEPRSPIPMGLCFNVQIAASNYSSKAYQDSKKDSILKWIIIDAFHLTAV